MSKFSDVVIACFVIGVVCLALGVWMIKTRCVRYVHPKYLRHVKAEQKPQLASWVGTGLILIGIGLFILSYSLVHPGLIFATSGTMLAAFGLIVCLLSILYFNGSLS